MHQAVHAADVDERAEVGQAPHGALHDGAHFQGLPDLLLLLGLFDHQHGLAGSHDALLRLVNLDDLEGHGLAHELVDLLDVAQAELGSGDEGADAGHVGQQATLDGFLAHALDELAGLLLCHDLVPGLAVDDVLLGQKDVALAVVHLDDLDFDLVVDLDIGRRKVGLLHDTVSLVADVDADFVLSDLHDLAGNDLAGANLYQGLVDDFIGHGLDLRVLFRGNFLLDVVHSCNNLLNYTIRRGCTGCNPDGIRGTESDPVQFRRSLDKVRPAAYIRSQLEKLATVRALTAADDQHDVRLFGNACGLALAVVGGGADGGLHLELRDARSQKRAQFFKPRLDHRGLADHPGPLKRRQRFDVLRREHREARILRPAQYPLHLRVLFLADHDQRHAVLRGAAGHVVDALDEGAGGVDDLAAPRPERLVLRASDAVGADHHLRRGRGRLRAVDGPDPHALQATDHLRVVDDGAQRHRRGALLRRLHRPAHAEAEPRVPGKQQPGDG